MLKKRKKNHLDKSPSSDLSILFLKFTEGYLITDHQKIYLRSEIKIDTKNYGKNHFNLLTG
jgi:hypothetical protein